MNVSGWEINRGDIIIKSYVELSLLLEFSYNLLLNNGKTGRKKQLLPERERFGNRSGVLIGRKKK